MKESSGSISNLERNLARELRALLADLPVGEVVPESAELSRMLGGLEWWLPGILGEVHEHWQKYETLDGFTMYRVTKTGELEVDVVALAYLISDMALVPCHIQLQLAESEDEVTWLICRIGEASNEYGGMRRGRQVEKRLARQVMYQGDSVEWAYVVGYGTRR